MRPVSLITLYLQRHIKYTNRQPHSSPSHNAELASPTLPDSIETHSGFLSTSTVKMPPELGFFFGNVIVIHASIPTNNSPYILHSSIKDICTSIYNSGFLHGGDGMLG